MPVKKLLGLVVVGHHIHGIRRTELQMHNGGTGMTVASGKKPKMEELGNRRHSLVPACGRELVDT